MLGHDRRKPNRLCWRGRGRDPSGMAASGAHAPPRAFSGFPTTCCGPGAGAAGSQKESEVGSYLMWGTRASQALHTRGCNGVSIRVTWEEPRYIFSNIQAGEGMFPLPEAVPFSVPVQTWARDGQTSSYCASPRCPPQMLPFDKWQARPFASSTAPPLPCGGREKDPPHLPPRRRARGRLVAFHW